MPRRLSPRPEDTHGRARPICRACRTSRRARRVEAAPPIAPADVEEPKKGRRPQMMRQYDLVERVKRYNPNADEDLLNRAYVYAMKAHGDADARLGRPVLLPSARSRRDPDRPQARRRHHRRRRCCTTRSRTPRRRAPRSTRCSAREIGALVDGLTKLKKLDLVTQARPSRPRTCASCCSRSPPTCACCWSSSPTGCTTCARSTSCRRRRAAASPRRRSTSMRRSPAAWACRRCARNWRTWRSASSIRRPIASISERLDGARRRATRTSIDRDRAAAHHEARRARHRRPRSRAGRSGPIRSGARWSASRSASSSSPTSSASASSSRRSRSATARSASCTRPGRWCRARFKDYISTPKQNDYRSIHTTVIGPGKQRVELQIRTARRWTRSPNTASRRMRSTRTGTARRPRCCRARAAPMRGCAAPSSCWPKASNPEEFLEHTKLELFHDQVFCFTPKGRLIALPRKATPIDFAYAVHTDVGNTRGRLQDQRQDRAARLRAAERRRGRDHHLEGADRAAGGLGIARRHRQGARRDPPRDPRRGAHAICRPRPADRRAAVPARQEGLFRREAAGRAAAARARLDRGRDGGGRARRDAAPPTSRARCIPTTRTSASRGAATPKAESGWFGLEHGEVADVQGAGRQGRPRPRSRSAASTATCRCASRRTAARCRATASSAS